jgi:cell division protein ZapA
LEIDGYTYRMACGEGEEERVVALAKELDSTIRTLKRRLGEIGDRRIAVMAGMTILDRLKDAEERIADMQDRIAKLERAREDAALAAETEDEPLIERLDAATAAVERLTRTLVDEAHALADEDGVGAAFSHHRAAPAATALREPEGVDEGSAASEKEPQHAVPDEATESGEDDDYPEFMQRY